jgi:hypothetical protein
MSASQVSVGTSSSSKAATASRQAATDTLGRRRAPRKEAMAKSIARAPSALASRGPSRFRSLGKSANSGVAALAVNRPIPLIARPTSATNDARSPPLISLPAVADVQMWPSELRVRFAKTRYRVLYQRSGNLMVLLHAFEKNTGAVPASDRKKAETRMDDFRARMDTRPRRPPRAAGRDALPGSRDG